MATVEGDSSINVVSYDTRGFTYYEFNLDPQVTTLFQDQRVRQAFFYALDREAIVNDIMLDYATVAVGTQPSSPTPTPPNRSRPSTPTIPKRPSNSWPKPAGRTPTATAPSTKTGRRWPSSILYPSGSPTNDQLVAYLQDAWLAIGVSVTPARWSFRR